MKFEDITISAGVHEEGGQEMCIMEAVAFIANEPHTDVPQCADPFLTYFMQGINDSLHDPNLYAQLKPIAKDLVGTRGDSSAAYQQEVFRFLFKKVFPALIDEAIDIDEYRMLFHQEQIAADHLSARQAARRLRELDTDDWGRFVSEVQEIHAGSLKIKHSAVERAVVERENSHLSKALVELDHAVSRMHRIGGDTMHVFTGRTLGRYVSNYYILHDRSRMPEVVDFLRHLCWINRDAGLICEIEEYLKRRELAVAGD